MKLAPVLVLVVFAAFGAAACKGGGAPAEATMTAADREELGRIHAAAKAKAAAYAKARSDGLRAAWRGLMPAPDGAPCGQVVPRPPSLVDDESKLSKEDRAALETARWRMNVVPSWAVMGVPPPEPLKMMQKLEVEKGTRGPRADQFERQSKMLDGLVTDGKYTSSWSRAEMFKLANELGSDEYWDWELDIVTSERTAPVHDATNFASGHVVGKAFVWSFREGKVVCTALVEAKNQPQITLTLDPNDKSVRKNQHLEDDLVNESYRAAIPALRKSP